MERQERKVKSFRWRLGLSCWKCGQGCFKKIAGLRRSHPHYYLVPFFVCLFCICLSVWVLIPGFSMKPCLALNSQSPCLSYLNASIIGMYYHAQQISNIWTLVVEQLCIIRRGPHVLLIGFPQLQKKKSIFGDKVSYITDWLQIHCVTNSDLKLLIFPSVRQELHPYGAPLAICLSYNLPCMSGLV